MTDSLTLPFNTNWKFLWGDPSAASEEDFDDSTWQSVTLPHDAVISRPFDGGGGEGWGDANCQGFFSWKGVLWYRKKFTLTETAGKRVFLRFGGAYRNSAVFVNGKRAGGRAYGYSSFELEITDAARAGLNTAAVRLDNTPSPPDRWYAGAGLYRNVHLVITGPVRIPAWGVRVQTSLEDGSARVKVETEVEAAGNGERGAEYALTLEIASPDGKTAAKITTPVTLSGRKTLVTQELLIKRPLLWSAETPKLYRAIVTLNPTSQSPLPTSQTVTTPFGLRTAAFAYKKGFSVNGQPVKLRGVSVHLESSLLGAAYYDEMWKSRLLSLKSLGCNAIRTSHNPPAEEFLDLCDELGFYVIDECFDKWTSGCYGPVFAENWKKDLTDFVRRDRNHPCVVLWSVGNEVENQGEPSMLKIQHILACTVRELDDRPVTCGWAPHVIPRSLVGAPAKTLVLRTKKLAASVDVLGFNYHEDLFADYTAGIEKPIVATESYEYYTGTARNYEDIIEKNPWEYVLENDNVAGQFVWAGFDYFGEAPKGSRGWPGAILDITGHRKPNAYFRKSLWAREPVVFIALPDPSKKTDYARDRWSFPQVGGHLNNPALLGRTVTALVFSNCEEVELEINGKIRGRRRPADFANGIVRWTFEYAEGEVTVRGFRKNKLAAVHTLKTAEEPFKIALIADNTKIAPHKITQIEVSITDKHGVFCPTAEEAVEFSLEGDGRILGSISGDLTSETFDPASPRVTTYGGRAQAIVRAGAGEGVLKLRAFSRTLKGAELSITVFGGKLAA